MSPVKRICVFEHSVMTKFNWACPAIQRGQGTGFLSEGSSWLTSCMSEQRRFWRDCVDAQARLNLRYSHWQYVPNSLDAVHMIWKSIISVNLSWDSSKQKVKCEHVTLHISHVIWKPVYAISEQQRCQSACASAQSDQHLCCSLPR